MSEKYNHRAAKSGGPFNDIVPVAPDDDNDLPSPAWALRIEQAGTIRITTHTGNIRELSVAAGERLEVRVSRVHATGTSASGIFAYCN